MLLADILFLCDLILSNRLLSVCMSVSYSLTALPIPIVVKVSTAVLQLLEKLLDHLLARLATTFVRVCERVLFGLRQLDHNLFG